MKKTLLGMALLPVLLLALGAWAGLTPAFVIHGPSVAAGMGAKLLCSAEYVSGYSRARAFEDLVQYSPLLARLDVAYDDEAREVEASLFGLATATASWLPGLGCAVDYAGYPQRRQLRVASLQPDPVAWPAGQGRTPLRADLQTLVESLLARDNASGLNTRALLVVHEGRIVAEAYGQQAHADMPLLGWSMAKSLMAVMLGNLQWRGMLDLQAEAPLTEWSQDARAAIRIEDLLTMTDGLDFSEQYDPGDDATAMLFTEPSMSAYALERPLAQEPGTTFNYSSGTANLLARVHHNVFGSAQAAYDDFINSIYRPMGFQHAVFEMDASAVFAASSYFYASARDWARLGLLMLNEGEINGQRLVSRQWVAQATSANASVNDRAYGYQWWLNAGNESLRLPALPADSYYANGNRQQYVLVVPSQQVVIVRLGWTGGNYPANTNFAEILRALESP